MSESPVTDIFDKDDITFPEELEIASTRVEGRKEFKETVKKVPSPVPTNPAYSIVSKSSLTEDEYKIFHTALEELDKLIGSSEGEGALGIKRSKLRLMDILANKFGFPNAATVSKDGMSFNLKKNYEVELVKKR